jgi:glycosyltransferase involved in cell wall biosynthesis
MAKLLFVCKRKPQGRCLLERPYGRFFHLPAELAALGHLVQVALVSHRGEPEQSSDRAGVHWRSFDLRQLGCLSRLRRYSAAFQPDWVIGCSDAWTGWLAYRIARRLGARLAIDAYDDYEAYMPWNLPLHALWRRALRAADLTTGAGPQLAQLMDRSRPGARPTATIPMAADPGFVPMPRNECRVALGMPMNQPIVGYSGGWAANRGTAVLPEAFRLLRDQVPGVLLAVTGRPPAEVVTQPGVLALGYLDDSKLPSFVNALNVATVVTTPSRFGLCSYPAKLCEAIACGIPVVATSTPPVKWMLHDAPEFLVPTDDPDALCAGLARAIASEGVRYSQRPGWKELASNFNALLTGRKC